MRLRMGRDLLLHGVMNRDLGVIAVLDKYRRIRERLGDGHVDDFERVLIAMTAAATAYTKTL
jgi:hypothetical protein